MILSQNALQYFLRRKLLISGFYLSAYPSFSIVNFLKSSRLKKLSPFLLCVYKFFVEGMELLRELYHALLTVAFFVSSTLGAKDKELYCGVCHVIADELQWEISQVDPRKMLEIESFRVDPKGNQKTRKIQYARSETHLIEQLDNMCEKMNNYAESSDPATGKKSYIRTSSRNGEAVTLSNVAISGDIAKKLKHACESIIEDYDDDIIATFKKERKDPKKYMCRTTTGLCIDDDDDEFSESDYDDDNDDGNKEDDATDHDEL